MNFELIDERAICYGIPSFSPIEIDAALLKSAGVDYPILDQVDDELVEGSRWYRGLFDNRALTPEKEYVETLVDTNEELEVHNYTGMCPANVLEVVPSSGSCAVACQYCLVTDGKHVKKIQVHTNYPQKLANSLVKNRSKNVFYYFSPKTEAFSEPHLVNGLAHDILRTFIAHFDEFPDSKVRIFIVSKAGPKHLNVTHWGESIFSLMGKIADKIQMNGSIGIMPGYLRDILEPNAADISDRLNVLRQCGEIGVRADSVLCQPLILPYLTNEAVAGYLDELSAAGVRNIKPEFFTSEVRNLVLVAQYVNHFDPKLLGEYFYPYLHEENLRHVKQRSRLAPSKEACVEKLAMIRDAAHARGITISLCNWVKRELGSAAPWVGEVDRGSAKDGYRCLGYQTRMFNT